MGWRRRWLLLAGLQMTAAVVLLPYLVLPGWAAATDGWQAVVVGTWAAAALGSAVCAWRRQQRGFEVMLWLSAGLLALHTLISPLQQVQVLNGLQLLVLAMIAAFVLQERHLRSWLAWAVVAYTLALTVNPAPMGIWLGPVIAGLVVVTTLVVCELVRRTRSAATHDPLTGALNRHGLRLQAPLLKACDERRHAPTAVAYLDLDGFKAYNDSQGHAAGDAVLVAVVDHLTRSLRPADLIVRVGGDEFVVIMSATAPASAERAIARVCEGLPIGCSHAVSLWPRADSLDQVLDRVDALMYEDKRRRYAMGRAVTEPIGAQRG